jgi:DNA-binding NarL/FixJ family response regulator
MNILIVDDHPMLRRGVKEIVLDGIPEATVGEAGTTAEMFALLRQQSWDLVLLDVSLPDRDGIGCLSDLQRHYPSLPILMLSGHAEEVLALPALRAGASGYIHKERAPEVLLDAIRRVLRGGKYVSADTAEQLVIESLHGITGSLHDTLSEREFTVMRMLAAGRPVHEIATTLFLSPKTITTYRARILDKMNLKTNADLTQYCMRNGLLD